MESTYKEICLPLVRDSRGSLTFAQIQDHIPGEIREIKIHSLYKGETINLESVNLMVINIFGEVEISNKGSNLSFLNRAHESIWSRDQNLKIYSTSPKSIFLELRLE